METLVLVRHAHSVSNLDGGTASCTPPGEGLTADGVEQARALASLLAGEKVELGVATELRRTQETLAVALSGREVPRLVVPELNEIGFGRYDGGPLADYRDWAWAEPAEVPAPGGGESRAEAAARYARGLRLLLARPEAVVVAVGHALLIRYVLDASNALVPAARIVPVEHASPYRLDSVALGEAASLLEEWSCAARFRDPSIGG